MSVKIKRKNGSVTVLLNPSEKGAKAAEELRNNVALTNDMHIKFDDYGKPKKLTNEQRAYRSGYLAAQKDSAKCWKEKKKQKIVVYK